jgi:hypothetical protein
MGLKNSGVAALVMGAGSAHVEVAGYISGTIQVHDDAVRRKHQRRERHECESAEEAEELI